MTIKTMTLSFLLAVGLLFISCSKEETLTDCEKTAYNSKVKTIINKSCNVTGCHDGSNDRVAFTSYTQVKNASAFIAKRGLELKNMPPAQAVANGTASALSADDMKAIQCWLDNGKKEN